MELTQNNLQARLCNKASFIYKNSTNKAVVSLKESYGHFVPFTPFLLTTLATESLVRDSNALNSYGCLLEKISKI